LDFRNPKSGRRLEAVMDVTPLIDVVFLLLIFFMITTTFVNNPGLEVDLPKANSADSPSQMVDLTIAVTQEGEIIFQNRKVSISELEAELESLAKEKSDSTVIVQADSATQHGTVVKVMDLAKLAGFGKLAIATQPE